MRQPIPTPGSQAVSQQLSLAYVHAGVFEAKHKSMAVAGQKGQLRYRAQMRRAVALSLQQAATAGGVPHTLPGIMTFNNNASMMGAMANRGVGAMLPQLAGAGHAAAGGVWGMPLQDAPAAATQQAAYVNALAAAAAASGLASASSLSAAAYSVPTGGLVLPGVHSLGPHAAALPGAGSPANAAAQFDQNFMPGGLWVSARVGCDSSGYCHRQQARMPQHSSLMQQNRVHMVGCLMQLNDCPTCCVVIIALIRQSVRSPADFCRGHTWTVPAYRL